MKLVGLFPLAALLVLGADGPHFEIFDARGKKPASVTIEAGEPDADGWFKLTVKGKGDPVLFWPYDGAAKVPAPRITLTPRTVAPGWTIVIAAEQIGPNLIEQAIGRFRGRLPKCISSHGTGPGLGNWKPTQADKANYKKTG